MAGSLRAAAAILAATFLLAACQPSSPVQTTPTSSSSSPVATPTPTFMCTPEAGGEASPCSQAQYDEMKAKDALYAEAEAVYRAYWAEVIRIMRAGGTREPTEVLLRTTTGFHQDDVMESLGELLEDGLRAKGDDPKIGWVKRLPGQTKEGSVVAISTCVDARGWGFYRQGQLVTPGRVGIDDLYFTKVDGSLRIMGADGEEAATCE